MPVSTMADLDDGVTLVGIYKGREEPLGIETYDYGYDNLTLSVTESSNFADSALALLGGDDETVRQLINLSDPASDVEKTFKYEYEGFCLADGLVKNDAYTYNITWDAEGRWLAFPSRTPDAGWDIKWVSPDAWTTSDYVPVIVEARLIAQS
jgi:hypothetical protein